MSEHPRLNGSGQSTPVHNATPPMLDDVEIIDNPWPKPSDIENPMLPILDLSLLPDWLGDFARALSASTETPPELAASMTLAMCATACQRRLRVQASGDHIEPCNLWLMVVMPSGSRKSAVLVKSAAPAIEWEHYQAEILKPEILQATSERKTAEARVKALRASAANPKTKEIEISRLTDEIERIEANMPEIPRPPRLWTSEATPEKLGVMLAENDECLALLSSEGGIFDLLGGRYSQGAPNLDLVLKAHAGDPDSVERMSRERVQMLYPRLTLGISPQPDVLLSLADKPGFAGRGLLARICYLRPESNLGYRSNDGPAIPETVVAAYSAGINAMLDWSSSEHSTQCHTVQLSPQARAEWKAFQAAIEIEMRPGNGMEAHTAWASKAPGAALRLAAVLHGVIHAHGAPWREPIAFDTMQSALTLMKTIAAHSKAALNSMGADPATSDALDVLRWLRRKQPAATTIREIHTGLKHKLKRSAQVQAAVAVLQESGHVRVEQSAVGDAGGRPPSPVVYVWPGLRGAS